MPDLDALKFEIQDETLGGTRIKVVGVGGGGSNAVNRMVASGVGGVEFFVMNTDAQALRTSKIVNKIALGTRITHGLGAGSDPEVGRQAALEDTDRIIEVLEGADMVFVAAGLGGGTGTGAAPVIAALAKELNALTIAVVTKPFSFEGPRRMNQAERGLAELHATVDCVISIPNDRLVDLVPAGTSFFEAFRMADDVLRQGVQGISDIITTPGLINRDFADVRAIMLGMGFAMMGTATAKGPNAAIEAAKAAIQCPLLEEGGLKGARAILLNITSSGNLSLHEMHDACKLIRDATGNEDVQINFGLVPDDSLDDEVKITVIATGFQRENMMQVEPPHVSATRSTPKVLASAQVPSAPLMPVSQQPFSSMEFPAGTEPIFTPADAPGQEAYPGVTLDVEIEPEKAATPAAESELPPPLPPKPAAPAEDDAFSLDDLDTPAFLRRERKLFQ
ncbi:cell division protein FtsZ [uncultured Paludibaculum sp.]|uniref:cell division protein FtsZ n=1 Tax=uncultured Paludibaculum sp. TaxID=1765020 RepID=UPI002AAA6895|nr:cell division protein FtsZ [uncultured Paludibaculum sp.]